jgi:hypothetical protein
MILVVALILIIVVVTAVVLHSSERFVQLNLRFREFPDGTTENPPYHALLGGFGTPVASFDSVPQLELVDTLDRLNIYNPSTPAAMYLQTANRSRIKNITV